MKLYKSLYFLLPFFTSLSSLSYGQITNPLNKIIQRGTKDDSDVIIPKIKIDIATLCAERLEGRRIGTNGNKQVAEYIEKRMKDLGLKPYADFKYKMSFKYINGKEMTPESRFFYDNDNIKLINEVIPFNFGKAIDDTTFVLLGYNQPYSGWLLPLYQNSQEAQNPNFDWEAAAYKAAKQAQIDGATAVYFYDSYGTKNSPTYSKANSKFPPLDIPVWYFTKPVYEKHIRYSTSIKGIMNAVKYRNFYADGTNIIGTINNNAEKTVVIFTNYDTKGTTTHNEVIPGANNNASAVAGMLQLARLIKESPDLKKYNYEFVAFDGKELNSVGAQSYLMTKNIKQKIAYIINFNMIGKLNSKNDLMIGAANSSRIISDAIKQVKTDLHIVAEQLEAESSDFRRFNKDSIPGFYISTGNFSDKNTAGDKISAVNAAGIYTIAKFTFEVIKNLNTQPVPTFNPFQIEERKELVAAAKVSATNDKLGIVLDTKFKDKGAKVLKVEPNSAGEKAGIKAGDIVKFIGSFPIINYKNYLLTIEKYKEGERAYFKVSRNNKEIVCDMNF